MFVFTKQNHWFVNEWEERTEGKCFTAESRNAGVWERMTTEAFREEWCNKFEKEKAGMVKNIKAKEISKDDGRRAWTWRKCGRPHRIHVVDPIGCTGASPNPCLHTTVIDQSDSTLLEKLKPSFSCRDLQCNCSKGSPCVEKGGHTLANFC